jgi:hypothetical protein
MLELSTGPRARCTGPQPPSPLCDPIRQSHETQAVAAVERLESWQCCMQCSVFSRQSLRANVQQAKVLSIPPLCDTWFLQGR